MPQNFHFRFAIKNAPPGCPCSLKTDKHEGRFRIGHQSQRVMQARGHQSSFPMH